MNPQTVTLAYRYVARVLPTAVRELRRIRQRAQAIEDPAIRREALASIRAKDFHVYGGSILATFLGGRAQRSYVRLVATFESAVDYLDNLCDRLGTNDEADFRALHESLAYAVTPDASSAPYFRRRSVDDGGYLDELVADSRASFAGLPAAAAVMPAIADITARYSELQARKHLQPGERERACAAQFGRVRDDLRWWEGAAASGSTMPTFALAYAGLDPRCDATRAAAIRDAYFPYFSALHILLDYLVDQREDKQHGELNFVACYPSVEDARASIVRIAQRAANGVSVLPDAERHLFALRAMCAFYCTRPQVASDGQRQTARDLMESIGLADQLDGALPSLLARYAKVAHGVV